MTLRPRLTTGLPFQYRFIIIVYLQYLARKGVTFWLTMQIRGTRSYTFHDVPNQPIQTCINKLTMKTHLILIVTFLLAACTPNSIVISPPSFTPSLPTATQQEENPIITSPSDSTPQNLIDKAKADLAQHLSISTSEIELKSAIEVIWPDSSLGCPQPGIGYAQVLTEGFLIYLEADDEFYKYHTDSGEQIILCDNLEIPIIPVTPGDIQDGIPWVP